MSRIGLRCVLNRKKVWFLQNGWYFAWNAKLVIQKNSFSKMPRAYQWKRTNSNLLTICWNCNSLAFNVQYVNILLFEYLVCIRRSKGNWNRLTFSCCRTNILIIENNGHILYRRRNCLVVERAELFVSNLVSGSPEWIEPLQQKHVSLFFSFLLCCKNVMLIRRFTFLFFLWICKCFLVRICAILRILVFGCS